MAMRPSIIAEVEADHTIKAPPGVAVGDRVLVVPMPLLATLLDDPARRARFAQTREAIRAALDSAGELPKLSNEEIVRRVKNARRARRSE